MALINTQEVDSTIQIFDNFYNVNITVPVNEYNLIYAYFKSVCETTRIAQNFTAFLFKVAQQSGVDAMSLLQNIKGLNNTVELNQTMAYYLNSFKSKHSLYGVSVIPKPVQPVARNVVL